MDCFFFMATLQLYRKEGVNLSKSVLLSVLNRDDKYPKMFDISAPYCCGAISLQCSETYTNQMLEELPNITFNIYTLQDDKYVLYKSRALSIVVPNNVNPISMALIDIPTSCILAITPEFDDYAFCSHNAEVNTSGGEKWLTPTTEFPIEITWDNTNVVADTGGGSAPVDTYTKEEIDLMMADKVSEEELTVHFIAGSSIEIVDNQDGTQTINVSGEVGSEDVVARAEIAAIKDGETLDSFSDVETALTTKANMDNVYKLALSDADLLPANTDLDNVKTVGCYYVLAAATAPTIRHRPTENTSAFRVTVELAAGTIHPRQIYQEYNSYDKYIRTENSSGVFDGWKKVECDLSTKQDTLTTAQLAAVNSGIDSTDVAQITTNKDNIAAIQQTIGNINQVLEEVL